jgi:hypothetical protein
MMDKSKQKYIISKNANPQKNENVKRRESFL